MRVVSDLDGITASFEVSHNRNGDEVSLSIPAIGLKSVTMNDHEYQTVSLPEGEHLFAAELAEEGEPDIPVMTTMLAIPDQAGIQLNVSYSGYDSVENVDLAPVQPSPSDAAPNDPIPFTLDQATYSRDAFYPGDLATADDPVIMRDVRGVQISINPVQYNPVRKELRVYRDLAISVSYGGEPVNPKTTRTPYLSEGFYPLYKSMFANFDQMFSEAEVKRGGYVIICKASIVDSLKALAMWKHQKGYTTRIVPTSEINSNGSPTAAQIFTYLQTAYRTWEVPPEYVMIVGDKDGSYGVVDYTYSGHASDQHYSQVDGNDMLPDIFVARLSVDNMSQLRIAVSKIFKYEKTPRMIDPQHWVRGLSVGYTYYQTARLTTLWARQLAMRHGFIQVDTVYGTGPGDIVSLMNSGPGMIWYRGAGAPDTWDGGFGVAYGNSDLNNMPCHQRLGICTPMTCGLGDFAYNDCFGENWIRAGVNPDSLKGGPGFFGVSDHYTHTKWNNPIMIGYFWGLFAQNAYHFAAAGVAGKLQDYRTFPTHRSGPVQLYFNTYNAQGDPELELRTAIPILINVTYPETLAFGLNHIEINVIDTAGHAVSDAHVTLIKMADTTEELYSLGKTDESGNLELAFGAQTRGTMLLTVSGQNLYPFVGHVELVNSNIAVGFGDSLFIDDDISGYSHGNGDSLANPNEILELYVALKNFGDSTTANNITTSLTSLSEGLVEVLDGVGGYGNLTPGESRMEEQPYVIQVSPSAKDGDIAQLKLSVTDQNNDSWYSVIDVPIEAPKFAITNVTIQDENNRLDPGDTVNMVITMTNRGHVDAAGVTASISSDDDFTTIFDGQTSFGDMAINDTSSSADSLVFSMDLGAFAGRTINFNLNTLTSVGAKATIPFTVTVDSVVVSTDPTGPDAYGYYMYDMTDTGFAMHPTYNWIELAPGLGGQGTRVSFGGNYDDKSVLITLPFDFKYYGNTYRKLIVCTNGFISPDTFRYDAGNYWADFFNWPIPDPGNARAQISPFWDDLQVGSSGNYGVYTWYDSTTTHRFVIAWNHATQRTTGGVETFEIAISDPAYHPTVTGDAEMLFQYAAFANNDTNNHATIGFENWEQTTGVQYTHDSLYNPGAARITNSFAILATTNTGRGGISGVVDLNNGGNNGDVAVSVLSGQHRQTFPAGDYWIKSIPPGMTSVTAQINGYFPGRLDSINVISDQTVDSVNFNLTVCPIPQDLIASDTSANRVDVRWAAVIHGDLAGYNLYRSRWQAGGFEKLNSTPILSNRYVDTTPSDSAVYWYYVTAIYSNIAWGTVESFNSNMDSGSLRNPTGINDDNLIPKEFFLSQNYPNPFNPTTTISYGLPKDSNVKIEIFNLLGQKVTTIIDDKEKAGYKSLIWNGKDNAGQSVSSGVYFYRIDTGDRQLTKKMMLLK